MLSSSARQRPGSLVCRVAVAASVVASFFLAPAVWAATINTPGSDVFQGTLRAEAIKASPRDQRPCVSRQEFRDVQIGWRQAQVADHFDTYGRMIGYDPGRLNEVEDHTVVTVWKYPKCSAWGLGGWYVGVGYANKNDGYPDRYLRTWGKAPKRPEQLLLVRYRRWTTQLQPDGGRACVTRQEYRDVRWGWRMARVANHFDTSGVEIGYHTDGDNYTETVRKYRKCSTWGPGGRFLGILYDNWNGNTDYEADGIMWLMLKLPNKPDRLVDALFGRNDLYW